MDRSQIHSQFADLFAADDPTKKISTLGEVKQLESTLGTTFPISYVEFITSIGSIFTPSLLDLVTGGESEEAPEGASFDVQNFLDLSEIEETAKAYWSAGMDESLIPIASDCMGNVFGFLRVADSERQDDQPIHVFDHDFSTVEEEHSTFDGWLESFIVMQRKTTAEQAGDGDAEEAV